MTSVNQKKVGTSSTEVKDGDIGTVERTTAVAAPDFAVAYNSVSGDDSPASSLGWYPQFGLKLPVKAKGSPPTPMPQTFQGMIGTMSDSFSSASAYASASASASVSEPAAVAPLPATNSGDALDRALAALKALGGDPALYERAHAEVLEAVGKGATRDSMAEVLNTLMAVTQQRGDAINFLLHEVWNAADNIGDVARFLPQRGISSADFSAKISSVLQDGLANVYNADQIEDILDLTLRAYANVPQALSP